MITSERGRSKELLRDFDLRDGRLMLSLGPLSAKKYCTFSCPFCYVHSNRFPSYEPRPVSEIVDWIRRQSKPFDIVYVSGDTDSFAPPRTGQGIQLLEALTEFKVDILFTTRSVFSDSNLESLALIQRAQSQNDKMLIGCVSISQLHHSSLEPKPIPSPAERIKQLGHFKSLNIISILAMRPFLPVVPVEEYIELADSAKGFVDIVLGSNWFADQEGVLESKVIQGLRPRDFGVRHEKMDFYSSDATWKVLEDEIVEKKVREFCDCHNLPFFMRSLPAVRWLRSNQLSASYAHNF